jgi:hypothetical protein
MTAPTTSTTIWSGIVIILMGIITAILPVKISVGIITVVLGVVVIMIMEVPFDIARKLYLYRVTIQASIAQLLAGEVLKSCRGTTGMYVHVETVYDKSVVVCCVCAVSICVCMCM